MSNYDGYKLKFVIADIKDYDLVPSADPSDTYVNINAVCLGSNSVGGAVCTGLQYDAANHTAGAVAWGRFFQYDAFASTSYCGAPAGSKPVDLT